MNMEWVYRWRRRKALLRYLHVLDAHYDALSIQYDEVTMLMKQLRAYIAADKAAAVYVLVLYVHLDALFACEARASTPIEDQLKQLESLSRARRWKDQVYDAFVSTIGIVAVVVKAVRRPIRTIRACKRRHPKTPAPPGNDESSRLSYWVVQAELQIRIYFFLALFPIAIFFGSGNGVSGTVTLRMPLSRCAFTLSLSARSGSWIRR